MNTQATATITNIVDLAIQAYPSDHRFTGYGVHTVINAINEVLELGTTAPQPIYGRIKSFLKVESMSGVTLTTDQAKKFLVDYFTGATKTEVKGLAAQIKAGLDAQATKATEQAKK